MGKRINEWERLATSEQPRQVDGKTSETVPFLFSYRGVRISKEYINRCLIPYLCRKANIPEEDSRGAITSHRARATIASMLYNAKDPLDIFQLQKYLGHKQLSSTQSYLQVDPTKLATDVVKAGYLEQNLATIEVLLDQEAVMNGRASQGSDWKLYDLGHGFCAESFLVAVRPPDGLCSLPLLSSEEFLNGSLLRKARLTSCACSNVCRSPKRKGCW